MLMPEKVLRRGITMKGTFHVLKAGLIICVLLNVSIFSCLGQQELQAESTEIDETTTIEQNTINDLPPYFSWTDVDGVDYTTSIKSQGACPTCEAHSLVAAVETMIQYKLRLNFDCDLSEAHLFFGAAGSCEWGAYIEDVADRLMKFGVPDEAALPYPEDFQETAYDISLNESAENWEERAVKITNWSYLPPNDETAIKQALLNGPVVAYIQMYPDFLRYKPKNDNYFIYRHRRRAVTPSPHYITIVGYNDHPGYWICKNSFGTNWGVTQDINSCSDMKNNGGWFAIAYGECNIETRCIAIEDVTGSYPICYVDDDASSEWYNNHNFSTIGQAIDSSYDKWTIFVSPGEYHENLMINSSIRLMGSNNEKPILDGSGRGDVIRIECPGVKIQNFVVRNSGTNRFDSGIKVTYYGDSKVKIIDNTIEKNRLGIYLYTAFGADIYENSIVDNSENGIYLFYSVNEYYSFHRTASLKILKNFLTFALRKSMLHVQLVLKQGGWYNYIQKNQICDNGVCGIDMLYSGYCYLRGNTISDSQYGIRLNYNSDNNFLRYNQIDDCTWGVFIEESCSNIFTNNNLVENDKVAQLDTHSYFDKNVFFHNYYGHFCAIKMLSKTVIFLSRLFTVRLPWFKIDIAPRLFPADINKEL